MKKLIFLAKKMRLAENTKKKEDILKEISEERTLTGKCILARALLAPQSIDMEAICRADLGIKVQNKPFSGDGSKNGINYEIKISIHAKKSKVNFVQIRPDHNRCSFAFLSNAAGPAV